MRPRVSCYECGREASIGYFTVVGPDLYHCRNQAACERRSAKARRVYKMTTHKVFSPVVRDGDCLLWVGPRTTAGYGFVQVGNRRVAIHRLVYQITHGILLPGEVVMHRCDRPPCIEPTHLRAGTLADNARDMWTKGRGRGRFSTGRPHGPEHETATYPQTEPRLVTVIGSKRTGVRPMKNGTYK